jgi:hypothetical protein
VRGEVRRVRTEEACFSKLYGANSAVHVRTIALEGLGASITDLY